MADILSPAIYSQKDNVRNYRTGNNLFVHIAHPPIKDTHTQILCFCECFSFFPDKINVTYYEIIGMCVSSLMIIITVY